jgi:hypothetical protein
VPLLLVFKTVINSLSLKSFFLLFIFTFGCSLTSFALYDQLSIKELSTLADDPTWKALLHYDEHTHQSTVETPEFFLSPDGRQDPLAELSTTIETFNQQPESACEFPARYYWLSKKTKSLNAMPTCPRFEKWALLNKVNTVSVLMVSGYLGNPASTFGHAMLKFNTGGTEVGMDLFDLTLNYGALIPEGENSAIYIIKGLTGGYEAGFSDRYFYTQDLVYSRTEFRDMWDYQLNLSLEERTLLMFHLWEIVGKKFKYYFLKENCAYKIAELLDLVIPEEILNTQKPWYPPVDLFYRLAEIDQERVSNGGKKLIKKIRYIPSSQRVLYSQLSLLSSQEKATFRHIIESDFDYMSSELNKHNNQQQISILDGLITYQHYLQIAEGNNVSPAVTENLRKTLNRRIKLPAQQVNMATIPDLPPPTLGAPPMALELALGYNKENKTYGLLNWSPYKTEIVGNNSSDGDELTVLDLTVGFSTKQDSIFLDRFNLIKIIHLNTTAVTIADQNLWSWQLTVGATRLYIEDNQPIDVSANFGGGRSWRIGSSLTPYVMLDASLHSEASHVRITPQLGLFASLNKFKFIGSVGMQSDGYDGQIDTVWEGRMQYSFNAPYALKANIEKGKQSRYSLAFCYFW